LEAAANCELTANYTHGENAGFAELYEAMVKAAKTDMVAINATVLRRVVRKLDMYLDSLDGDGVAMAECQGCINELQEALK
jgi:hypothetical protein